MAFYGRAQTIVEQAVAFKTLKKLTPLIDRDVMDETSMAEYRAVAERAGVSASDLVVEDFRLFLAKQDIPTFRLEEVVSYMDALVKKDNPTGYGWHWCPVRSKDTRSSVSFGQACREVREGDALEMAGRTGPTGGRRVSLTVASDYYDNSVESRGSYPPGVYGHTIPIHALNKIVLIEEGFGDNVLFFISDYTLQPHWTYWTFPRPIASKPDPFLMAVIPNSAIAHGKGRFVIDVWDEPGFGIERMVK